MSRRLKKKSKNKTTKKVDHGIADKLSIPPTPPSWFISILNQSLSGHLLASNPPKWIKGESSSVASSLNCIVCPVAHGSKANIQIHKSRPTRNQRGKSRQSTVSADKSAKPNIFSGGDIGNSSTSLVEMLHFVCVDCLGLVMTRDELTNHIGKCNNNSFLCEIHHSIVEKGLETDKIIRKMIRELGILKKSLREGIQASFPSLFDTSKQGNWLEINGVDGDDAGLDLISEEMGIGGGDSMSVDEVIAIENVEDVEFDFCEIDPLMSDSVPAELVKYECDEGHHHEDNSNDHHNVKPSADLVVNGLDLLKIVKDEKKEDLSFGHKRAMRSRTLKTKSPSRPRYNYPPLKHFNVTDHDEKGTCITSDIKSEADDEDSKIFEDIPSPVLSESSYKNDFDVEGSGSDWEQATKKKRFRSSSKRSRKVKTRSKPEDATAIRKKYRPNRAKREECHICKKCFLTRDERNSHRLAEHGVGPYFQCEHCSQCFNYKIVLSNHMQRAHSTDAHSFLCDQCPKTYAVVDDLRSHKRKRHSANGDKIVTCPYCTTGRKYKGDINLLSHIRTFHKGKEILRKHLVCEFCGKAYSNAQEFQKHRQKLHLNTYLPSICDICGKSLSDPKSLKKHKLSQHSKAFQYKCDLCGAGCLFKSHLIAHFKHSHSTLSPQELNDLVTNCKKILDNTNPIYQQEAETL